MARSGYGTCLALASKMNGQVMGRSMSAIVQILAYIAEVEDKQYFIV
jgi:hypothetical protein